MIVNGKSYKTIGVSEHDSRKILIIDQRHLPHHFLTEELTTLDDCIIAIKDMHVRGAGLIGAAAGFGMYLASLEAPQDERFNAFMNEAAARLKSTRPTAVNLAWAADRQLDNLKNTRPDQSKSDILLTGAIEIAEEDTLHCRMIGEHGLKIIEAISHQKNGDTVNILTHCNAGWLAFTDYGTATSPIYAAQEKGIKLHVWVDETRPRNQGASLTAWELEGQGIPHTIIADNTGGHLMQHGLVDLVIVGSDRTTVNGDVANKIGTYLKALAAKDNNIPFYAAMPSSTIDWSIEDGIKEISIEERNGDEVKYISGLCEGEIKKVLLTPERSPAANFGFDVTPARLVTGIITERGICEANKNSILNLFPERKQHG